MPPVLAALLLALFLAWPAHALAQVDAEPLPGDPRLVEFAYDEHNSFRIFTRRRASTHIQLEQDEFVKDLILGDKASWVVEYKGGNHLFLKPRYANLSTPGTLITNKRVYQVVLVSSSDSGRFFQRVSFFDPAQADAAIAAADLQRLQQQARLPNPGVAALTTPLELVRRPSLAVAPDKLNHHYEISGNAPFRPVVVYDDGTVTYVQMPPGQSTPAVFSLTKDNEFELMDFVRPTNSNTLHFPRIVDAFVLKLGSNEVRVHNRQRVPKTNIFGWPVRGGEAQ